MTQVQQVVEKGPQVDCPAGGFEEVTCSFCGGKGTDPFGILSWVSTCVVCGGRGSGAGAGVSPALRPLPGDRGHQALHLYGVSGHWICAANSPGPSRSVRSAGAAATTPLSRPWLARPAGGGA